MAVGIWKDGRVGTLSRAPQARQVTARPSSAPRRIVSGGDYSGYEPLVVEIVKFFKTGKPPVSRRGDVGDFAFMEAADESKRQGGRPVSVQSVMEKAAGRRGIACVRVGQDR